MNDYEDVLLLEKAARAAGLPWDQWVIDGDDSWNPLTDDGDAFRLAVKLRLEFKIMECDGLEDGEQVEIFGPLAFFCSEKIGDDECAATRRAIVRAAAAITPSDGETR